MLFGAVVVDNLKIEIFISWNLWKLLSLNYSRKFSSIQMVCEGPTTPQIVSFPIRFGPRCGMKIFSIVLLTKNRFIDLSGSHDRVFTEEKFVEPTLTTYRVVNFFNWKNVCFPNIYAFDVNKTFSIF
jgi:hypothetical protein